MRVFDDLAVCIWPIRFNDEHEAPVPEWFNDNIKARREEAYNHLITYARLVSKELPDSYSKLNLHTLVCRLRKQETARGSTSKDSELWMERAVRYPCLECAIVCVCVCVSVIMMIRDAPKCIAVIAAHPSSRVQMRDVKGAVKGHGTGSLELRFAKLYCEKERVSELRGSLADSDESTPWMESRGFRNQEEATFEWSANNVQVLDKGITPSTGTIIEEQCRAAFKTALDNGDLSDHWKDLNGDGSDVR